MRLDLTESTAAHEFLAEFGDINPLITDALACPKRSSWHWPSFYLMYVEVDHMLGLLTRVGYHFESPVGGLGEPPDPAEAAESANQLFRQLDSRQKAVVRWLFQLSRYTQPDPGNPAPHQRLQAHVHPKSGWHQVFMNEYRSGVVSADGKSLTRTVLPAEPSPSGERIDHISAGCMLRRQAFDLGAPGMEKALAHAACEAAGRLGKIAHAMHLHLVENCTIHDLMHPSSH